MVAVKGKYLIIRMMFILLMFIFAFCAEDASAVAVETIDAEHQLTKGVFENKLYTENSAGSSLRINVLYIDKDAAVKIIGTYGGYYRSGSIGKDRKMAVSKWSRDNWECKELIQQINEYNSIEDKAGEVIAASNADHFLKNGEPRGNLILEGNVIHQAEGEPFFAVLKNGMFAIKKDNDVFDNIEYAVGGSCILLHNRKVLISRKASKGFNSSLGFTRQPRQAIGLTENGSIILVNIEGRTPGSDGTTLYETARIMQRLGCCEALNLDGGGSASFLTKRQDGKGLRYRNQELEGYRRNIASGLLVVKNINSSTSGVADEASSFSYSDDEMIGRNTTKNNSNRKIKRTNNNENKKWIAEINSSEKRSKKNDHKGLCFVNGKVQCFDEKEKPYSGTLKIGHFKYRFSDGKYISSSDKSAGKIEFGYCGAKCKEKGIVYIYHHGDKLLNIGLNPFIKIPTEMMDWDNLTSVPWYSLRMKIEKVYVGNGVKSVGDLFLCIPDGVNYDGTKPKTSSLRYVKLDKTVKKVGYRAFYNTNFEAEMIKKYGMRVEQQNSKKTDNFFEFSDMLSLL